VAEFVPDYDITTITPAEYNPRFLSEDAFDRLCLSIQRFGIVKPIIANRDGTIVAGHQRVKALTALGITYAPVMILDQKVGLRQEIHFNLVHNSIELAGSEITVPPTEEEGYMVVRWQDIEEVQLGESPAQLAMCATSTHTSYWSERDTLPLRAQIQMLRDDLERRSRYIDPLVIVAMNNRLALLETATELLTDRAD